MERKQGLFKTFVDMASDDNIQNLINQALKEIIDEEKDRKVMIKPRFDRFWRQALSEIQTEANKTDFNKFNEIFQAVFDSELEKASHLVMSQKMKTE